MATTARPKPTVQPPTPPGPKGHFFFGSANDFSRDPLAFARQMLDYGDVVKVRFGPVTEYFLNHPDLIKHVLQDNHRNYTREKFGNELLKLLVGDSVLTTDGDYWLRQRRLMAPAFHRQRIFSFGQTMTTAAETMLAAWQPRIARDERLDINHEMTELTFHIVGLTLFSMDLRGAASTMGQALEEGQAYFNYRTGNLFPVPLWVPTPRNRRFKQAKATIDRIIRGMIAQRRASGEEHNDLMGMLMAARDEETGEGMTDQQLLNEIITMVAAGHETTSNALTWTFYLLSQHPEVEATLHAELDTVLAGRTPTTDDLPRLSYTKMVLEESMRLFPPAYIVARQSRGPDELGGYPIDADTGVIMCPYAIHRHPDFWEEPERFDPERFTPERSAGRPKYAYFPFGGGPHFCIGHAFAMTEAQLLLATIAQQVRLRLVPGHPVVPQPLITLRTRYGLKMQAEKR